MRVAEEDGRILGYAVLKRDRDLGYIADLLALPNRLDVVRSLVEDALRSFREADVAGVVCWMTSRHPYNGLLGRYGFVDSRRDTGFAFRPVTIDPAELAFLRHRRARIHLTHGDADLV